MINPQDVFEKYETEYRELFVQLNARYNLVSTVRVVSFLLFIIGIVYFLNERSMMISGILVVSFLVVFIVLIKVHNRIRYQRDLAKELQLINSEELDRLKGNTISMDGGDKFQDKDHPYTSDLDIFGDNSLFQLVSHATTDLGKQTLAKWFLEPEESIVVRERQVAVEELAPDIKWRQLFEANGRRFRGEKNKVDTLLRWLKETDQVRSQVLFYIALAILPIVATTTVILFLTGELYYLYPLAALGINGIVLWRISQYSKDTIDNTNESLNALAAYEKLIELIEKKNFSSDYTKRLKSVIDDSKNHASKEIAKLKGILNGLESRLNIIYGFFNVMWLLELYWLIQAERWRSKNKGLTSHWFEAISELESLTSLSAFSFSNPEFSNPEICDEEFVFEAEKIGHPLILIDERVSNNFNLQNKGAIAIVTGSNMSGKSTFLRTLGINIVLALSGSVVCANKLKTSKFCVFTSMRTQDSLKENISSFYAELKRIEYLLAYINEAPVFFFLDELLKGTNSKDRNLGATSLVHQLAAMKSTGIMSTHDLELASLSEEVSNVKNYSFNSRLEGDELIFDYTLSDGACKSFNASVLMQKIGIKII